jgi:hypothetical protein
MKLKKKKKKEEVASLNYKFSIPLHIEQKKNFLIQKNKSQILKCVQQQLHKGWYPLYDIRTIVEQMKLCLGINRNSQTVLSRLKNNLTNAISIFQHLT